jgi:hypothetical protein
MAANLGVRVAPDGFEQDVFRPRLILLSDQEDGLAAEAGGGRVPSICCRALSAATFISSSSSLEQLLELNELLELDELLELGGVGGVAGVGGLGGVGGVGGAMLPAVRAISAAASLSPRRASSP